MISSSGRPTATPPRPVRNTRRFSLKDAIFVCPPLLFLLPIAERFGRDDIEEERVERVAAAREALLDIPQDGQVLRPLAAPHREAIHLLDEARLELARRDEELAQLGRAIERAHAVERAVAADGARGVALVVRPVLARLVV